MIRNKPLPGFTKSGLIIGLFVIILIGLNSCCTKKYCPGAEDISPIELLHFSAMETDSVYLVLYEQDSEFKTAVDSLLLEISQPLGSDKFYAYPARNISTDFDYRLYFTLMEKTYEITAFKTGKSVCNDCFLSTDYYTRMEAYKVNGKLKTSHVLQIDKLSD
jgi:hypothetical protein